MQDKKTILAPAKLNLFLKIVGRKINGYHLIHSGITFLNLFDKIQVEESNKNEIFYKGLFKPLDGNFNDCIINKTLNFIDLPKKTYFKITITKNIPVQGGLGSASTNAASLILLLNKLKYIKLQNPKKYILIGSDVPCFLFNKNCIVNGVGDIIEKKHHPKYYFLLVMPNFTNSTKNIYSKLGLRKGSATSFIDQKNALNYNNIGNDFEEIVSKENSEFELIMSSLKSMKNVIFSRMTGTGSCCYAAFEKKEYAIEARNNFKNQFNGLWTYVCENNTIND